MSLRPLPDHVAAQITSSTALTSLNAVVTGLIRNALDATASHININVDYSRGHCCVEDDGLGIPPAEFGPDGGLAQLHFTSKFPPRADTHGRHGMFLASVSALSLCTITSHYRGSLSHNTLVLHNSTLLARHTPCAPEQRVLTFPSHGTRVTVSDLFGSMPVRVKHRALQAEKSSFSRDWDRLVLQVVALLLAWPSNVSVSMRDASGRPKMILKTGSDSQRWLNDSCRLLHHAALLSSPDTNDWVSIGASAPTLQITCHVCRDPVATKRLQFMSLGIQPLSNESRGNVLYEEVNRVFTESDFGALDDSDSQSGPRNTDSKARKGVDRWPVFILRIDPAPSERAGVMNVDDMLDEHQYNLAMITDLLRAMFYEFLKKILCRPKKVHSSTRSTSRLQGARNAPSGPPSVVRSSSSPAIGEPVRKAPRLDSPASGSESPVATWSKIKSGQPLQTYKPIGSNASVAQVASSLLQPSRNASLCKDTDQATSSATKQSRPSLYDANGKLTRMPFDDWEPGNMSSKKLTEEQERDLEPEQPVQSQTADTPTSTVSQQGADDTYDWINPVTKMMTTINCRTGLVKAAKPLTLSIRASKPDTPRITHGIANQQLSQDKSREEIPWIRDLASKWKNPVFDLAELPIPRLPDISDMLGLDVKPAGHQCRHPTDQPSFHPGDRHEATTMSFLGRISIQTLRRAQLIAQVDNKFILARMPMTSDSDTPSPTQDYPTSSVLVLIDQHAADERCRVEALMQEYFAPATGNDGKRYWTAVTEAPPKPIQFELSRYDGDLLGQFKRCFAYWGIHYTVHASDGYCFSTQRSDKKAASKSRDMAIVKSKAKVTVHSLPPAIVERCRTEPRLLAELIRKEAWRLSDEEFDVPQPRPKLVTQSEADPKEGQGTGVNGGGDNNVPIWVSLFHGCPQGIIELINSRSCRSAIMFNDILTLDECYSLFGRLLRCAFPFQCAHGRPSMVPIVNLGGGDDGLTAGEPTGNVLLNNIERLDERYHGGSDFVSTFKAWMKSKEKQGGQA